MRLHEHFPILWPSYDEAFVRRMLRVENLAAVRLEPVYSVRFEAFMDALFECDGDWLIVPMLRIEGVSIMVPENPPIAWPVSYERFAGEATDAIDAKILPWLRSVTAGRLVNDEQVRFFRDEPEIVDAYERARRQSLFGATSYPDVLRSVGAAVYALRFARARSVALAGENAANGAAILSSVTSKLHADLDTFERRWLAGVPLQPIDATTRYACYVGPRAGAVDAEYCVIDGEPADGARLVTLAEPIPTDVTISFDAEDAPEARRFSVSERALGVPMLPLTEAAPAGGSSGVVRIVVRDDAARFPDADTDAAAVLAERLRAEGFDAAVTSAAQVDRDSTDIIHVFGLRHGVALVELMRDAERRRIPVVVTPYADDRRDEAVSGASGSLLIPRVSSDTIVFYDFVDAFARRKIANLTEAPWYDDASAVLMTRAAAAVVSCPAEAQFLRERFGFSGTAVPSGPLVPLTAPEPRIGSLVGDDEFILMHGPIEPRNNHVFAALAAQRHGLPLVILGPVADIEFFRYLNEAAGTGVVQLRDHELSAGEIAGVYARARVFADVGWSARGAERVARGACFGAAIVAPQQGYLADLFPDLVTLADPGSLDSMSEAFRRAWERAPQERHAVAAAAARVCDPTASLVASVSAYQQASAVAVR